MKIDSLETWLNFRIDKKFQEQLDIRAKQLGVSRAELARKYFKMGIKLPDDVPQTFALLLYERTLEMKEANKIREIAIATLKELFYVTKN